MTFARFTIAYWCVLIAALLPIACAALAKYGMMGTPRRDGGFDNHNPRGWLARQTDWRGRANAAQHNTFEALPFFFAAVIIALATWTIRRRHGAPAVAAAVRERP